MKQSGKHVLWSLSSLLIFTLVLSGQQSEVVTTGLLFREMTDMSRLSLFPAPAFKTVQFSSYDRRSRIPGGPGWYANADGFGGEPTPNFEDVLQPPDAEGIGEYLIADVSGPGAIVRLWSAAITGKIKLFLDGSETPLYEGPAIDFFHKTYDSFPQIGGIDHERFSHTVYQRDASYAPIPFSQGMRLVWIGNIQTLHFYQVGVRLYKAGTVVASFSPKDLTTYKHSIDRVTASLADPDGFIAAEAENRMDVDLILEAFSKKQLFSLQGPKAVKRLAIRIQADNIDKALRQTILHVVCDDYPWGQVQSPVGDFFGAAPGINPYVSLPFSVLPDGTMVSRFVMPCEKSMTIQLENLGEQKVGVFASVTPAEYEWIPGQSMHFRARWRADHNIVASNTEVQDMAFLVGRGKGVYVGTSVYLLNPNPIPTPGGSWWGEGDEKIFIDEDSFPSHFGTGSEDYYNYSWSNPELFHFPYCGQPRNDGPANRGFVTNFRWHILDSLPFQSGIAFYMELFSHERTPGFSYARIGYHYALPGMVDDHSVISAEDVRFLELPELWYPASRRGARNSVFYAFENNMQDRSGTTIDRRRLWAGSKCLVWTPGNTGHTKSFTFDVETAGKKRLHIVAALTPDSGSVSFRVDDKPVTLTGDRKSINLLRPYRTLLRDFILPDQDFTAGQHTLTVVFEGAPTGITDPKVWLDFFFVQDRQ